MTTSRVRQPFLVLGIFSLILGLLGLSMATVVAQGSAIPDGAPVDLHSGICTDALTEPAYDAGDISPTNSDDVWGEEGFMSGILVDDAAGVSGVDRNGDGTLQPDEVIVLNGEQVEIGEAEATFDTAIDLSQPLVVAVHAGPDDLYTSIIACGEMNTAQDVAGDRQLVTLNPVGDSQLFGYAIIEADGTAMTTYLFQANAEAAAMMTPVAGGAVVPTGYPIEVHAGSCQDWTTEPAYDIGDMQETNVAAPGEQEPGDTGGDVPQGAEFLGSIYHVDTETDFDGNQLLENNEPYVVTVHESAENYTTLVACGPVAEVYDDDDMFVILQPVGGSNMTGFVQIGQDEGEVNGYLWTVEPYQADTSSATPTPMPTMPPVATPTVEPTATPVGTAVITTTEVVPAPTATAMAGGDATPTPESVEVTEVEIGGEEAIAITASVGQTLTIVNSSENERIVSIPDLQIEETVGPGEQIEIQIPQDAQPGTFTYEVLEGEDVVLPGELTVE